MGIRKRNYWLRQADAIRRQNIAMIAHGVGIGFASREDKQKAIDELELVQTADERKRQNSDAFWSLISVVGKGKAC